MLYDDDQSPSSQQEDSNYDSEEDDYYKNSVIQDMPVFEKSLSISPLKRLVRSVSGHSNEIGIVLEDISYIVQDPLDLIERGMGRNRWHSEFMMPPDSDSMTYCQIHKFKGKKTEFLMFMEYEKDQQFQQLKLYAKFRKNEWLIYPFDPTDPYFKKDEYLFKLVVEDNNYYLWSTSCQSCSLKYKSSCVSTVQHREQLLVGQNYKSNLGGAGLNLYRAYIPKFNINEIPSPQQQRQTTSIYTERNVWCPSTLRSNNLSPLILRPSYSLRQIDLNKITNKEHPDDAILIHSKLPEWSSKDKCWVMQSFGRIKMASKRNFQLKQNYHPQQIIFQMGKLRKGIYILDYRRPLCFVQALSIGLATNEWKSTL